MKLSELIRNAQMTMKSCGDIDVWIEDIPDECTDAVDTDIDTYGHGPKIGQKAFVIWSKQADKARNARAES